MNIFEASVMLLAEVTATVLIVWGVFGYDIKWEKKKALLLALAVAATIGMAAVMVKTLLGLSSLVYWGAMTIIPVALLGIRTIGIILATVVVISRDIYLGIGILMILIRGEADIADVFLWGNVLGYVIALFVAFVLYRRFNSHRKEIHKAVETRSQLFYFLVAFFLFWVIRGFGVRDKEDSLYYILEGVKELFNAGLCVLIFAVAILYIILKYQQKELHKINMLNKRCISEQTRQYVELSDIQMELRKFRHDYGAHLTAIYNISRDENAAKTEQYVHGLLDKQETVEYVDTGNIIGDAVINKYYRLCHLGGFEMEVMGAFNQDMKTDETDLCVILTNAVANAYEATIKCKGEKILDIRITNYKDRQFIKIINSVAEDVVIKDSRMQRESSKDDKENHGFGIMNLTEAVERNGGAVVWEKVKHRDVECILTDITLR